jgi:hypothetical protein
MSLSLTAKKTRDQQFRERWQALDDPAQFSWRFVHLTRIGVY